MAGRKSLIWKLILPVPVMTVMLMLGAWLLIPSWVERNATEAAIMAARQTVGIFRTLRGYYTENVVSRLAKAGTAKAVLDYRNEPGAIPLPATLIHEMDELLAKQDMRINLFSIYPFPNRKDRKLDAFQQDAWNYLVSHPDDIFTRQEMQNGEPVVRVALPDRMVAQACVDCHNTLPQSPKTDWKIGDVRGVIEVDNAIGAQIAGGRELSNTVLLVLGGGSTLLVIICIVVARGVSRPLLRLADAMRRLGRGDKSIVIADRNRADEIGEMAEALGVFHQNAIEVERLKAQQESLQREAEAKRQNELRSIATQFRAAVMGIVEEVGAAAEQVRETAESLSETANGLDSKAVATAAAAEQASGNVSAIATGTEQLAHSIEEISRQASDSKRMATDAVTDTRRSDTSMQGLSDTAQKIGEVIALINNIASQTNLLALNATIEAARAGEAGKGFAVVAAEVKSLANQTAKATEEIANQVRAIQQASMDAVTAIGGVGERIAAMNDAVASIATAVEEQGAATRGIAENVQSASAGVEAVSGNIRDMHQSAASSSRATRQFLSVTSNLAKNAQRLRDDTERFLAQMSGRY